jgi:hypothetical protein
MGPDISFKASQTDQTQKGVKKGEYCVDNVERKIEENKGYKQEKNHVKHWRN